MRALVRLAAAASLALLCGCKDTPIFHDVGVDVHQPSLRLLGIAYQPVASGEGETPEPDFRPVEGFVIRPNQQGRGTVVLQISYADAGADISTFNLRDLQSELNVTANPAAPLVDIDGDGDLDTLEAPEFFVGTVGLARLENILLTGSQSGTHAFELWAEDSLGSRSEKIHFTLSFEF